MLSGGRWNWSTGQSSTPARNGGAPRPHLLKPSWGALPEPLRAIVPQVGSELGDGGVLGQLRPQRRVIPLALLVLRGELQAAVDALPETVRDARRAPGEAVHPPPRVREPHHERQVLDDVPQRDGGEGAVREPQAEARRGVLGQLALRVVAPRDHLLCERGKHQVLLRHPDRPGRPRGVPRRPPDRHQRAVLLGVVVLSQQGLEVHGQGAVQALHDRAQGEKQPLRHRERQEVRPVAEEVLEGRHPRAVVIPRGRPGRRVEEGAPLARRRGGGGEGGEGEGDPAQQSAGGASAAHRDDVGRGARSGDTPRARLPTARVPGTRNAPRGRPPTLPLFRRKHRHQTEEEGPRAEAL